MIILVLGRLNSGKSKRAEDIVMDLSDKAKRLYIATMIECDEDSKQRIEKHREARDGKGFETVEWPVRLFDNAVSYDLKDTVCLIECISNLVGNEMHDKRNEGMSDEALADMIADDVMSLAHRTMHTVMVTNDFTPNEEYDEETLRYIRLTKAVNKRLKKAADVIHELTDGEWRVSEDN